MATPSALAGHLGNHPARTIIWPGSPGRHPQARRSPASPAPLWRAPGSLLQHGPSGLTGETAGQAAGLPLFLGTIPWVESTVESGADGQRHPVRRAAIRASAATTGGEGDAGDQTSRAARLARSVARSSRLS